MPSNDIINGDKNWVANAVIKISAMLEHAKSEQVIEKRKGIIRILDSIILQLQKETQLSMCSDELYYKYFERWCATLSRMLQQIMPKEQEQLCIELQQKANEIKDAHSFGQFTTATNDILELLPRLNL